MNIPKRFDLMGTSWTVLRQAPPGDGKIGCTDFHDHIIYILPSMAKDAQESTFVHELLHIIVYLMGLDRALKLSEAREETLVNALANGLYAAIQAKIL